MKSKREIELEEYGIKLNRTGVGAKGEFTYSEINRVELKGIREERKRWEKKIKETIDKEIKIWMKVYREADIKEMLKKFKQGLINQMKLKLGEKVV